MGLPARTLGNLEARHAGHLNVQEQYVRRMLFQLLERLEAVGRNRADHKLRPQVRKRFAKLVAKVGLVLGYQRPDGLDAGPITGDAHGCLLRRSRHPPSLVTIA